jgi:1-acyl-sn-glycerol-3-phosphate acyltransferase
MENYHSSGGVIANHRSYFDPIVIVSHVNAFPVARKKLHLGLLLAISVKSGVVFVDRKCQDSRPKPTKT